MDYSSGVVVLAFLFLFQIKHLFVDFFYQPPYMWMNKHKFFHPGGWLHAGFHAVASFWIFALIHSPIIGGVPWYQTALLLCGSELIAHFLIDLTKMRIGMLTKWKPDTSPEFWSLLGIDQFLHQLTYIIMVGIWVLT